MHRFLLYFLLLLAAVPTAAQPAQPISPAAPDTVAALHRLFARKRHQRNTIAIVGFASGTTLLVGASQTQPLSAAVLLGDTGLLGVLAGSISLLAYRHYAPAYEQQAVAAFQAHQLPSWLRRRLRPRYFREHHA